MKRYHSLLFVPAKEKMMIKIKDLHANAYIIDLEDSIEDESKDKALFEVDKFLKQHSQTADIFVRVNRSRMRRELETLDTYNIGFMIPKLENSFDILSKEEKILKTHKTIGMVETPLGAVNIESLLKNEVIDGVSFGGEDYTALTNVENAEEYLFYVKSRIVMYAKAYKKAVYDTPSFSLQNEDAFRLDVKNSVKMGFDGKMAINPKQIDFINSSFCEYDFGQMKQIIIQYEKIGNAVAKIDGKLYEGMHIEKMKRILKENGEI